MTLQKVCSSFLQATVFPWKKDTYTNEPMVDSWLLWHLFNILYLKHSLYIVYKLTGRMNRLLKSQCQGYLHNEHRKISILIYSIQSCLLIEFGYGTNNKDLCLYCWICTRFTFLEVQSGEWLLNMEERCRRMKENKHKTAWQGITDI